MPVLRLCGFEIDKFHSFPVRITWKRLQGGMYRGNNPRIRVVRVQPGSTGVRMFGQRRPL
jgi:hypothetical protein